MKNELKTIMKAVFGLTVIMVGLVIIDTLLITFYPQDPWTDKFFNHYYLGIQSIILIFTLGVYIKLADISNKTLQFTKTQTAYNSYFDRYKIFLDLSKKKTDELYHNEIDSGIKVYFNQLSFDTLNHNFTRILKNYTRCGDPVTYEKAFKRFLEKIQSFINILQYEISQIKTDDDINDRQRQTLLKLYKDYLLSDYIIFSKNKIEENKKIEINRADSTNGLEQLLSDGKKHNLDIDNTKFFSLYNEFV